MTLIKNTKTDPNKLLPTNYPWALQAYKTGVSNNWTPEEVVMQNDIEAWKSDRLTEQERKLILYNLGFFSTAESITANNIALILYKHITDPCCRLYLIRQLMEESIHSMMFVYCCDSLGLNPDEIYTMYNTIPSIKDKDDFVIELTKNVFDKDFEIKDSHDAKLFLRDLIGYYVIMEGIFFYGGFAMMLALKRKGKMVGVGEQFEYVLRDEFQHLDFGFNVIDTLKKEEQCWDKEFEEEIVNLVKKAVELETAYAIEACPEGIVGITSKSFINYIKYIADLRLERLGIKKIYNTKNPLPWMSESVGLRKEKNFFETTVTEYQGAGSLKW